MYKNWEEVTAQDKVKSVKESYEGDQKDKISIKKMSTLKKKLLWNLNDLYTQFQLKFPTNNKTGLSKFADLWPKHCALVESSGIHSVCMCTIHQNAQLVIAAAGIEERYQGIFGVWPWRYNLI